MVMDMRIQSLAKWMQHLDDSRSTSKMLAENVDQDAFRDLQQQFVDRSRVCTRSSVLATDRGDFGRN